jgi:hypothetical protein
LLQHDRIVVARELIGVGVMAAVVGEMLKLNDTLRFLDLQGCNIGQTGCRVLVEALLARRKGLRELYLGRNAITDLCVPDLERLYLVRPAKVVSLQYADNKLSEEAKERLGVARFQVGSDVEVEYRLEEGIADSTNSRPGLRSKGWCAGKVVRLAGFMATVKLDDGTIDTVNILSRDIRPYARSKIRLATALEGAGDAVSSRLLDVAEEVLRSDEKHEEPSQSDQDKVSRRPVQVNASTSEQAAHDVQPWDPSAARPTQDSWSRSVPAADRNDAENSARIALQLNCTAQVPALQTVTALPGAVREATIKTNVPFNRDERIVPLGAVAALQTVASHHGEGAAGDSVVKIMNDQFEQGAKDAQK